MLKINGYWDPAGIGIVWQVTDPFGFGFGFGRRLKFHGPLSAVMGFAYLTLGAP